MHLLLFEKIGAFVTHHNQESLKHGYKMKDEAYARANYLMGFAS
jgi:hypothetical protein